MYRLVFIVAILGRFADALNHEAEKNNQLLRTLEAVYDNLAIKSEDNSTSKQQFSMLASAVLLYITSDYPDNDMKSFYIAEQARDLHNRLTPDVVAADMRRNLDLLVAYIGQPINDVKRSCPPTAAENACIDIIMHHQARNKKICPQYLNHVDLYNMATNLAIHPGTQDFLKTMIDVSKYGKDFMTLCHFVKSVSDNKNMYADLKTVHETLTNSKFPCTFLKHPTSMATY